MGGGGDEVEDAGVAAVGLAAEAGVEAAGVGGGVAVDDGDGVVG